MKCTKCKGEWTPPQGITITECPFCKESFAPTKIPKTYHNAKDALKFIIDNYGAEGLLTRNLFSDIAPTLSDTRDLIKMFREKGALDILNGALDASPSEQSVATKRAIGKLPSYLQNSPEVIALMNDFVDVLNWEAAKLWSPQQFQTNTTPQYFGGTMNTLTINKTISFGGYDWRVLDVQNGQALLLCDKVIEKKRYHSSLVAITWAECELREYLNGSFYDSLGADRERIVETQISNPQNLWAGTVGGNSTRDRVFLLSIEEIDKYFGNSGEYADKIRKSWSKNEMKFHQDNDGWYISNEHNKSRIAEGINGEACWWWLRSPGKNTKHSTAAALVNANGLISVDGNNVNQNAGGVRPALWLKSTI